jgi:MFS family permease
VCGIDFWGAATAAGATVCLVFGLNWGGKREPLGYAWNSPQVIGILVAAAILFLVFLVIERYVAAEPILPLDLFKNPIFRAGSLLALMVGMALFALVLYLPLYIQGVLGYSPTNSGIVITPLTLALAIGAAAIGRSSPGLGATSGLYPRRMCADPGRLPADAHDGDNLALGGQP